MKRALAVLPFLLAVSAFAAKPSTIANNDSCDVSLLPAATLLLPHFEVDLLAPATTAWTTLFTVQNTTAQPQIARVTLWTDWAYPMLTFNLFLTGYDVQGINLYDVFTRGAIAPGNPPNAGTSNLTAPGPLSAANDQNPHFLPDAAATCSSNPGFLSNALLNDVRTAFTAGKVAAPGCAIVNDVGGLHRNAAGFVTIDVVANCNATSPLDSRYFTREILFDNVLTGDYQGISPNPATGNYAGGNPLVHIRAVPAGGAAGTFTATKLPFTFYDLYTAGAPFRTYDRRQPLPSAFMPRFINGGTGAFNTNVELWREALAAPTACPIAYASNSRMRIVEAVRFDEHENATTLDPYDWCGGIPECPGSRPGTPASAYLSTANTALFPSISLSGDVGGWLFLNLNHGGARPSQAWVVTSMFAEGRYQATMDAVAVGNGCSPAPPLSKVAPIGPAP